MRRQDPAYRHIGASAFYAVRAQPPVPLDDDPRPQRPRDSVPSPDWLRRPAVPTSHGVAGDGDPVDGAIAPPRQRFAQLLPIIARPRIPPSPRPVPIYDVKSARLPASTDPLQYRRTALQLRDYLDVLPQDRPFLGAEAVRRPSFEYLAVFRYRQRTSVGDDRAGRRCGVANAPRVPAFPRRRAGRYAESEVIDIFGATGLGSCGAHPCRPYHPAQTRPSPRIEAARSCAAVPHNRGRHGADVRRLPLVRGLFSRRGRRHARGGRQRRQSAFGWIILSLPNGFVRHFRKFRFGVAQIACPLRLDRASHASAGARLGFGGGRGTPRSVARMVGPSTTFRLIPLDGMAERVAGWQVGGSLPGESLPPIESGWQAGHDRHPATGHRSGFT